MRILSRCRAIPAALAAGLILAGAAQAETANTTGSGVKGAMTQEHAMLRSGGARIVKLTTAARPMAREATAEATVTVASRSIDGLGELAEAPTGKLSFATLDALPPATGNAEWQCLAEAIYFESRGEPLDGQIAVAEVVLNRRDSRQFPSTVCGVTRQGCQFSYTCDGHPDTMRSGVARARSEKLASLMLAGRARTLTDGALYFHTPSVRPSWSRKFTRTTTIGHHIFYRPATRVAEG